MIRIRSLSLDGGRTARVPDHGLRRQRLSSVTDSGSEEAGTHSYSYDASGNLTRDGRKRLEFTHNVLNLPMSVRERDASGQHMTGDITYTIDEDGTVELYQETDDDYDQLYVCWGEGPLDQNANSIIVNDKTILESMSKGKMLSSSTDKDQMRNIMHFAADNFSKQEWGLFYNDKNCELVTQGKSCRVKTSLEDVTWKEHSHPNAESSTKAELYSMMGCWLPEDCYTAAGDLKKGVALSKLELELNTRSDCYKVKNNNGPWVRSQVYMVKSGRTYVISPLGFPILMK